MSCFVSSVWDHFVKNVVDDCMICQICPEDLRQTTGKLSGIHATNAKKHFRFNHKDAFEAVEKSEQQSNTFFTKRISCFDHNLELVLTKSIEKNCKRSATILRRARKTLRKAKNSVSAKASLKQKCGKSFIMPGVTRWGASYLMASRITEIWRSVNEVWCLKGWPIFLERDIRFLEQFCKLVEPFYEDLMGMQADSYVTSSSVYVRVKELLKHCDKFRDDQSGISELAADIKRELVKRFGCFVDNRSPRFNAHFVIASLLDPSRAFMVDMDLPYLIGLLSERLNTGEEGKEISDSEAILEATEDESFEGMMLRKRKNEKRLSSQPSQNTVNNECSRYLQSVMCDDMHAMRMVDPIPYWLNEGKAKYPMLALAALDYLAVPATSAPVERCFSAAGLALAAKSLTRRHLCSTTSL